MLTHSWWFLACDVLATYRLAVLITEDKITDPAREWLRRHGAKRKHDSALGTDVWVKKPGTLPAIARWTYELTICAWCIGLWLATIVVILTRFWPSGWQYPAMALALSGMTGFLGERTNH